MRKKIAATNFALPNEKPKVTLPLNSHLNSSQINLIDTSIKEGQMARSHKSGKKLSQFMGHDHLLRKLHGSHRKCLIFPTSFLGTKYWRSMLVVLKQKILLFQLVILCSRYPFSFSLFWFGGIKDIHGKFIEREVNRWEVL